MYNALVPSSVHRRTPRPTPPPRSVDVHTPWPSEHAARAPKAPAACMTNLDNLDLSIVRKYGVRMHCYRYIGKSNTHTSTLRGTSTGRNPSPVIVLDIVE